MIGPLPISRLRIWSPSIPMKQKFRHAAAERSTSDPIILEVELAGGLKGYGETHPRTYVTGESHDDILATIRDVFVPILVGARPQNFGEAIELAASLPVRDTTGRVITATRAASSSPYWMRTRKRLIGRSNPSPDGSAKLLWGRREAGTRFDSAA